MLDRPSIALAVSLGDFDQLDVPFEELRSVSTLELEPLAAGNVLDRALLAAATRTPSGQLLYAFVGLLGGVRSVDVGLEFASVDRFYCPVIAWWGERVLRTDLLGPRDREWRPARIERVLPFALARVPEEAHEVLALGARAFGAGSSDVPARDRYSVEASSR